MQGIVFDLILVATLLFFAQLGAKKGLVLTLFSLAAVVVSMLGGTVVSRILSPALTAQVAPLLQRFLEEQLSSGALILSQSEGFLGQLVQQLLQSGVWTTEMPGFLAALSEAAADAVLRPLTFLVGFVLVMVAWTLVSRALDLIARLPVLHQLNTLGGFLVGAVKGALLFAIAALVIWNLFPASLPAQAMQESQLLPALRTLPPLF